MGASWLERFEAVNYQQITMEVLYPKFQLPLLLHSPHLANLDFSVSTIGTSMRARENTSSNYSPGGPPRYFSP